MEGEKDHRGEREPNVKNIFDFFLSLALTHMFKILIENLF